MGRCMWHSLTWLETGNNANAHRQIMESKLPYLPHG